MTPPAQVCPIPDPRFQTRCNQFLPGFAFDNTNSFETGPAGNLVSSDGMTSTGMFTEFSLFHKTLTSIYILHQWMQNLCQQPKLLSDLLFPLIRLQRTFASPKTDPGFPATYIA